MDALRVISVKDDANFGEFGNNCSSPLEGIAGVEVGWNRYKLWCNFE